MKQLIIQLQRSPCSDQSINDALDILAKEGFSVEIDRNESDIFINLKIKSKNLSKDWGKIKSSFIENSSYSEFSIVVCEGEDGWNDYLLLHHFDPSQKIDTLFN